MSTLDTYMRLLLSEHEDRIEKSLCGLIVVRSDCPLQELVRDALCLDVS